MDNAEPTINVTVQPYFIDNNNRRVPYKGNDEYENGIVVKGLVKELLEEKLGNIVEPEGDNKFSLLINALDNEADDEDIPNHYNDWQNFIPTLSIYFNKYLTLKFEIVAVDGVEFAGNGQQAGRYSRRRSYKRHTHKRRRQLRRKSAKRTRTRRRSRRRT